MKLYPATLNMHRAGLHSPEENPKRLNLCWGRISGCPESLLKDARGHAPCLPAYHS
jgi:hypothetical protein